ncbi:hypothetical protein H6P81_021221 [Aristolochia fimbriata]|uniref:Uncharacterized protein n=1 Tax=Aristolochia fimbriata TaxID=158543 RepID=A0AAV7DRH9_ARIFI|nr:hypothetical protein H6P81_021221 [Aristolochia fimbriata]
MNTFVRPAFEHTGVRLSGGGKKIADARLRPPVPAATTGRRTGFKGTIHQGEPPFGEKNTQAPGECQRPNKAAGGPCSEGKAARRGGGSSDRKHHSRMSSVHHSPRARDPTPMPGPCMASQQRRHRRPQGKSRSGEGAPNGPAERRERSKKLELGKRVARTLGPFPAREKS